MSTLSELEEWIAVLDHGPGPEDALLGRLGHQHQGAGPVATPGHQLPRRADQGGDVHVVTAGMHDRLLDPVAVDLTRGRGIGQAAGLLQRQAVHVGADHHRRAVAVAQHRDHAGATDAGRDVIAEGGQPGRHDAGGADLHPRQFGMAMEVVEQGREVGAVVLLDRRRQGAVLGRGGQGGGQGKHGGRRRQSGPQSHGSAPASGCPATVAHRRTGVKRRCHRLRVKTARAPG